MASTMVEQIDQAIQQGLGAAASVIGQTYAQYRLGPSTSGGIVSGTPLVPSFPASLRRTASKMPIEGTIFDLICYIAVCDNRSLELQDVLVENGYEAMAGGVYVFVQARPTQETLWMRAESYCQITRPTPGAGNPSQAPPQGGVSTHGLQGIVASATDAFLALTNGVYSFESTGTPAAVPCGLQPTNRIRDGHQLGTPTDQPRAHYLIYVPLVGGEQIQEYDRIKFPNGDSYEVLVVNPSLTGITGYVTICEKRAEG